MLLSYPELKKLVEDGIITNVAPELINAASIDLTLGAQILVETRPSADCAPLISLRKRQPLNVRSHWMTQTGDGPFHLRPGKLILASTQQVFHLPDDISAEYKLKSSMARIGLEHLHAGWADAGWHGSVLTLELKNLSQYHTIELNEGDRIGQMVFFRHTEVPPDASYAQRGRYNRDQTVKGVKE